MMGTSGLREDPVDCYAGKTCFGNFAILDVWTMHAVVPTPRELTPCSDSPRSLRAASCLLMDAKPNTWPCGTSEDAKVKVCGRIAVRWLVQIFNISRT
jgi:hypothetical protein